jgi:hypothetical protein
MEKDEDGKNGLTFFPVFNGHGDEWKKKQGLGEIR